MASQCSGNRKCSSQDGYGQRRTGEKDMERVQEAFRHRSKQSVRTTSRETKCPPQQYTGFFTSVSTCMYSKCSSCKHRSLKIGQNAECLSWTSLGVRKIKAFYGASCSPTRPTIHVSGMVNRRNVLIWCPDDPHEIHTHWRAAGNKLTWGVDRHGRVIGPSSWPKKKIWAQKLPGYPWAVCLSTTTRPPANLIPTEWYSTTLGHHSGLLPC